MYDLSNIAPELAILRLLSSYSFRRIVFTIYDAYSELHARFIFCMKSRTHEFIRSVSLSRKYLTFVFVSPQVELACEVSAWILRILRI